MPTTGNAPAARRGLTLIEMLAVLAIIVIISSALIGAGVLVSRKGQHDGTVAIIEQLKTNIEQYANTHDGDVPSSKTPISSVTDPQNYGVRNLHIALRLAGLLDNLSSNYKVDTDGIIKDTYGNALVYDTPPYDASLLHDRIPPRGGKYILFSKGRNGKADLPAAAGQPLPDDDDDIRSFLEIQ